MPRDDVTVCLGEELARYAFGQGHPFSPARYGAFRDELVRRGLDARVVRCDPRVASAEEIAWFHTPAWVARVAEQSRTGAGFLDYGDTPAFPGVYEAAATVVGTTLAALERVMSGDARRAFTPIGGLHHARRDGAAGFCVFNDCGVAIDALRRRYGVRRIAYVDIDAHHGDGVFYAFESDPDVVIVDFHEDGRWLYPGTGAADETGRAAARGSKLNVPLPPGAGDEAFLDRWSGAEDFLERARPEFVLLQCGADSLAGDPITHLAYTETAHRHAAARLCALAERHCDGRILAMGGGGYALPNIARAWTAVVEAFLDV